MFMYPTDKTEVKSITKSLRKETASGTDEINVETVISLNSEITPYIYISKHYKQNSCYGRI